MSILIKGMEMPKDKAIAVVIHPDGTAYSAEMFAGVCTEYLADCTAVPVPPHGRLGDLDAIKKEFDRICDEFDACIIDEMNCLNMILASFYNAPTIIPAEEGE